MKKTRLYLLLVLLILSCTGCSKDKHSAQDDQSINSEEEQEMKIKEVPKFNIQVPEGFENTKISSITELKGTDNKSTYFSIFTSKTCDEQVYVKISNLQSDMVSQILDDPIIFHTPSEENKFVLSHWVVPVREPKQLVLEYMKEDDLLWIAQTEYNRVLVETEETEHGYYVIVECTSEDESLVYLTLAIRDSTDNLMHYSTFEVSKSVYDRESLLEVLHSIDVYKYPKVVNE